jgi:hypothetical protein
MHRRRNGTAIVVVKAIIPIEEKVKRANKFSTPGPETDKHGNITGDRMPLVSMVDDSTANIKPRKSVLPKSMEMLKRPGVNITGFSSTVDNEGN